MAIPSQTDFHRPLLEVLVNSRDQKSTSELYGMMIDEFKPTEDDLAERMPNGALRFHKKMLWAIDALRRVDFIIAVQKGEYKATDAGVNYLKESEGSIMASELRRMRESARFETIEGSAESLTDSEQDSEAPPERIRTAWLEAKSNLVEDILHKLQQLSGRDDTAKGKKFEQLVLHVLRATGFDDAEHTGKGGDGGVDGILLWGPLGITEVYVQAKWRGSSAGSISSAAIDQFSGSLDKFSGSIGFFITNSTFSGSAKKSADRMSRKIHLIDGRKLAETMIKHGVGVKTIEEYKLQELDESFSFFTDED